MTETTLRIEVAPGFGDIARAAWDGVANPGWVMKPGGRLEGSGPAPFNPFLTHDFLVSLEDSGSATEKTGWSPCPILVRDASDAVVGAAPVYLKSHSQGEYVFDHGWAEAFHRAGGRYYPILQVSVPFTPVPGPRVLVAPGPAGPLNRGRRVKALAQRPRGAGASSDRATFLTPEDRDSFVAGRFLERTDRQFHWQDAGYGDFEGFLAALSSRKRKQIRRERRDALAGDLTIRWLTGDEIQPEHWDAFFAFYTDTGDRKWGRPYLNRRFFTLIGERMAHRVALCLAHDGERPIAGALNFIGSDTLYGRYWGALEERPFLHFEVCYYQAIDFALAHGLAHVEAGAQGEHKLFRGYLPVETRSAHWIAHPGLRAAVADYLVRERAAVADERAELADLAPFRRDTAPDDGD